MVAIHYFSSLGCEGKFSFNEKHLLTHIWFRSSHIINLRLRKAKMKCNATSGAFHNNVSIATKLAALASRKVTNAHVQISFLISPFGETWPNCPSGETMYSRLSHTAPLGVLPPDVVLQWISPNLHISKFFHNHDHPSSCHWVISAECKPHSSLCQTILGMYQNFLGIPIRHS